MDSQDAMAGSKAQLQKLKAFSMYSCIQQPHSKQKSKSDAKPVFLSQIIFNKKVCNALEHSHLQITAQLLFCQNVFWIFCTVIFKGSSDLQNGGLATEN